MKILKNLNLDKLSKAQLITLSEIARDIAQVIFGGLVINQALSGVENIDWLSLIFGLFSSVSLWALSVVILKK